MDSFARGLKVAHQLIADGVLEDAIEQRYSSFKEGIGKDIVEGKANFHSLESYALKHDRIENESGRQEVLRGMVNQYLVEVE
jgi:xylose isomerase